MTAQPVERTDLELIDALDYDHTPPCEHSSHGNHPLHDGPAHALVHARCPACGDGAHIYLCRPVLEGARLLTCDKCGLVAFRNEMWRVIALVRP